MKSKFILLRLVSIFSVLSVGLHSAYAQDEAAENNDEQTEVMEIIEVTGYQESLRKNLSIKKNSDTIVDAVSAEDIGRFPDINVADALQRIAGVQVERDERTGESVRVSVRGTAPHLNLTQLNNQQIASATYSNRLGELRDRSFNYFLLPTELVETLEVYKSAEANVDEGSVGGTAVVRTRKPLDAEANSGAVSARYFHFENADTQKPHVSGLYNWKNAAETFGFNLAYVYNDRATQLDSKRNLGGYFTPRDLDDDGRNERLPVFPGANRYVSDFDLSTPFLTLQYAPTGDLDFVATAFQSRTRQASQGLLSYGFGSLATLVSPDTRELVIEDETVVSASNLACCDNFDDPGLQGARFDTGIYRGEIKTTAFDLKGTLTRQAFTASLQAGHSFADGFAEDLNADFGARSGLGFDLSSGILEVSLGDVPPSDYAFDSTHLNRIYNDSDETYFQADIEYNLENDFVDSIETGFKFRSHNKSASLIKRDFDEASEFDEDDGSVTGPSLADFAGTPITSFQVGAPPPNLWQVSANGLRQWQASNPEEVGTANRSFDHLQHRFDLNEKVYAGYLKANFEFADFRGNVGIRAVQTNTDSTVKRYEEPVWNPRNVEDATVKNNYTDILPSININYLGLDDIVLRFAASKVMSRPNYVDVTAREIRNCEDAQNELGYECTGREGNPELKPFRLTQYDISAEYYIDDYSFLAVGLFHKNIESYIAAENITAIRDYAIPVEGGAPIIEQREFTLTRPTNGLGGTIQGFEVSFQQRLPYGFGAQANYTYADANLEETPEQIEEGIEEILLDHSKHTYNATLFYRGYGLDARVSYTFRSRYRYDLGTVARNLSGFKDDFGQLDLNASYALTDEISLIFQVINLTNAELNWYASDDRGSFDSGRPIGRFNHGRRYGLGLNVGF